IRPVQMAFVIDEYGTLRGIVTQTDLLETLAGEIPDGEHCCPVEFWWTGRMALILLGSEHLQVFGTRERGQRHAASE
ncbi:MAG TPA: hypothetical protein VGP30_01050, partial [Candidatus Limnocylindrales bacterium]|nr:hypothetical protein [Candidatus Limnocylindrales bacterium]